MEVGRFLMAEAHSAVLRRPGRPG